MDDKLKINNQQYKIIDTKEKMTVPDCFVLNSNKIGKGNGEAKFYVGNDNNETRNFFGERGFNINCFLLKKDLIKYLDDCKDEYLHPEQPYQQKDKPGDGDDVPHLQREIYLPQLLGSAGDGQI